MELRQRGHSPCVKRVPRFVDVDFAGQRVLKGHKRWLTQWMRHLLCMC